MVKKTIIATLVSTGVIVIALKVGIGAFFVDFFIRMLNPFTPVTARETAHILFTAFITAIITTLILTKKVPKFLRQWL